MSQASQLQPLQQGVLWHQLKVWVQTNSVMGALCDQGTEVGGREAILGVCDMQSAKTGQGIK